MRDQHRWGRGRTGGNTRSLAPAPAPAPAHVNPPATFVRNGNLPTGFVWKQCAVHRLMEDKGYLVLGVYTKRRCFNIAISPTGLVKVYDQTKRTDKDYMKKMAEGR